MPSRLAPLAFLITTLVAAPALACGPTFEEFLPLLTVLLAVPPAVLATIVLGLFARRWNLGLLGWIRTSVASYGAAALAGGAGLLIMSIAGQMLSSDAQFVIALTSPAVGTVAYVAWIRSRRSLRGDRVERNDAA